jgi:hypothetical protein
LDIASKMRMLLLAQENTREECKDSKE